MCIRDSTTTIALFSDVDAEADWRCLVAHPPFELGFLAILAGYLRQPSVADVLVLSIGDRNREALPCVHVLDVHVGGFQQITAVADRERKIVGGVGASIAYGDFEVGLGSCLLYTSPSPRDRTRSRMPSSA